MNKVTKGQVPVTVEPTTVETAAPEVATVETAAVPTPEEEAAARKGRTIELVTKQLTEGLSDEEADELLALVDFGKLTKQAVTATEKAATAKKEAAAKAEDLQARTAITAIVTGFTELGKQVDLFTITSYHAAMQVILNGAHAGIVFSTAKARKARKTSETKPEGAATTKTGIQESYIGKYIREQGLTNFDMNNTCEAIAKATSKDLKQVKHRFGIRVTLGEISLNEGTGLYNLVA